MRFSPLILPVVVLSASVAEAKIKLPALVSDHMVLQQEVKANCLGLGGAEREGHREVRGQDDHCDDLERTRNGARVSKG
jgi:hypothetical protein